MFEFFKNKNILNNQKKCLASIEYLLNPDIITRYNEVQGLIKYHVMKGIIEPNVAGPMSNPLYEIKKFYEENLSANKRKLMTSPDNEDIKGIIESDEIFLKNFTNDYSNKYIEILNNIAEVEKNKKYLDDSQLELLEKYNSFYAVKSENQDKKR